MSSWHQDTNDAVMEGFLFLKEVLRRWGDKDGADLITLADRCVRNGHFKTRREAVEEIERQYHERHK